MNTITVEEYVDVPIRKTWEFWNMPEDIVEWCHASDDWHTPRAKNDLKVGGRFLTTMAARDGSSSFDFEGVYTEVVPLKRIKYSMADGRQVTILFDKEGRGTKITETFDPESENTLELQRSGWQSILENFKIYAEKNK